MFILIFHVVLNDRAKQEIFKTGWKNVGRVRAFVAGQPYHSSSYGGSKVHVKLPKRSYFQESFQSSFCRLTRNPSILQNLVSFKDSDASQSGANNGAANGRISSVVFTSGVDMNANSSSVATIETIVEDNSIDDKTRGKSDEYCGVLEKSM